MTDERFETASRLADDIRAKAEELSTAIYEASKMGYAAKVSIRNGVEISDGTFIGSARPSLVVKATIPFDIGNAI